MKNYQKDNLNIIGRIMIQLAQFLAALNNLVRSGVIKKVPDAIKFAEQQFGKVTPLLKKQIERVFENIKKPVVGKPGKKEGAVLPMVKEGAKKAEGIETLDQSNIPEYDPEGRAQFEKDVKEAGGMEEFLDANPINPRRPGGSLDPATGITRALARRILDRKGIEIGKKDPIDVFTDTFGEAISDVNNLAEEMIEIDSRGGGMKDMDKMLEIEGLFDIEIPTNPQKGLTDDELLDLVKKTEEEEVLKDFDPKGRKPNATGGLTRTNYAMGKGPVLPEDPTKPVNPFGPKPTGPVLPDKSMMAEFSLQDYMDEFERVFPDMTDKRGTQEYMDMLEDYFRGLASKDRTSSRVQAASGGLASILKV